MSNLDFVAAAAQYFGLFELVPSSLAGAALWSLACKFRGGFFEDLFEVVLVDVLKVTLGDVFGDVFRGCRVVFGDGRFGDVFGDVLGDVFRMTLDVFAGGKSSGGVWRGGGLFSVVLRDLVIAVFYCVLLHSGYQVCLVHNS